METAVYFILFLCGILSQGICKVSEDNNEKSDILIRRRRVSGGFNRSTQEAPSLVAILLNENFHCPATLLSNDVAITSAQCVKDRNQRMMRIQTRTSDGDHPHEIVRVMFFDPNYNTSHQTINNLALVKFAPPISLSFSHNRPISFFNGNLAAQDLLIQVFNWGRSLRLGPSRITSTHLRSINMRLISIQYCQEMFPGMIGRGNLCAYPAIYREHCHDGDTGSPLFAEEQLLGIMVFHGHLHHTNPEVFMNLLDPNIRHWIHQHVPSLR